MGHPRPWWRLINIILWHWHFDFVSWWRWTCWPRPWWRLITIILWQCYFNYVSWWCWTFWPRPWWRLITIILWHCYFNSVRWWCWTCWLRPWWRIMSTFSRKNEITIPSLQSKKKQRSRHTNSTDVKQFNSMWCWYPRTCASLRNRSGINLC